MRQGNLTRRFVDLFDDAVNHGATRWRCGRGLRHHGAVTAMVHSFHGGHSRGSENACKRDEGKSKYGFHKILLF